MTTRDRIESYCEGQPTFILPPLFDDAILGIGERCGQPPMVAYDRDRCIDILMTSSHLTRDDAEEVFNFNTAGGTPIISVHTRIAK